MANQFGGFGDNQGFGGFGQQSTRGGLTVDELLNVARLQGGRVAEVAEELANPRRSMMATMGNGLKNAFTGFLDIIAAPGQIVAGAVSSKHTIGEALEKNISVSDIVFGDKDVKDASLGAKIEDFISRTAVDVLTDPLTFLTFGATRGILGVSAAPKFFAGEKTAKAMGLKNVGDKAFLSEFGEKMADDYVEAISKGNKQGFFLSKRDEILEQFGKNMDEGDKLQMHLGLKEFDDEMSDVLTKNILNGRLRQHDAVNAVGKLIEKHPALIETFVDKGGIKFFGKTILSSQRIRGIRAVIPGITTLDNFTAPFRNAAGAAFNRNYRLDPNVKGGGGRISDEAIQIEQKWKDMSESMNNELMLNASKLYKNLGITKQEDQFITAAIELGLEPADARNSQIWSKINGIDKDGPIREEVWTASGFVKDQLKYNYDKLRESGVSISNLDNYFPHIAVKQQVGGVGFRTPAKKAPSGAKFAKASVLVDEAGNRYPTYFTSKPDAVGEVTGKMLVGDEIVEHSFKVVDTKKEIKEIRKIAERNGTTLSKELKKLVKESTELEVGAKASITANTVDEIVKRMKDVAGIGKEEKEAIAKSVEKFVRDSDVTTMVSKRLKNFYKDGLKLKTKGVEKGIPVEELDDIISALTSQKELSKQAGKSLLSRVNKVLDPYVQLPNIKEQKFSAIKKKKIIDEASQEVIDQLKLSIKKTREDILGKGINKKNLESLVSQIVGRTAKNPGALRTVIDKLIKNKQLVKDLSDELETLQKSVEIDIETAIEQGGKFLNKTNGKALTRARATIPEARELGIDFADSSLTGMLLGSMDAIKVSVGRNFMKEMGEKMGISASRAPEGYRKVAMTGIKMDGTDVAKSMVDDAGEELYFHPLIAKQIEEFSGAIAQDEATESILKSYDKMQNVFKATVTSIFPAFHGRNAISNVMLNLLDIGANALSPVKNVEAGNMIYLNSKMAKLHQKMLAGGKTDITSATVDDFIEESGGVVYHGTKTPFEGDFDISKAGTATDSGLLGKGLYFTSKKAEAVEYAGKAGEVKEVVLDMKNPLVIDDITQLPDVRVTTGTAEEIARADELYSERLTKELQKRGYDGVVDKSRAGRVETVVFNADQIKTRAQMEAKFTGAKEAREAAKEYSELMSKEMFTDDKGYKWSFGELRTVMHNNVVAFHPRNLGQIDQAQFAKDNVTEIAEKLFPTSNADKAKNVFRNFNPFSTKNLAVKTGLKVGSLVEDYSRTLNFMTNLKATGDPLLAAERTKMFLFDYQNLSNFERNVMRRIIPFYCVPDDTEAMTRTGWKLHKDIEVGDELLTVNTDTEEYEWQPMLEKFVAPYNDYLTSIKSKRYSLDATLNHRWVVEDYKNDLTIKKCYELNTGDKIKTSFKYLGSESKFTKEDARLLGWLLTDGYFRTRGNHVEAVIYQSPKKFLEEVKEVAGGTPRKPHPDTGVVCVPVLKERVERIKPYLKRSKKEDNWNDFVGQLGREELEAMYDAMYKADGTTSIFRKQDYFACDMDGVGETFQMVATLLGKRAIKSTKGYYVSKWTKLGVKDMKKEHYFYDGNVWCPRTENGTWVMRQRGFVTATGNTFSRKNLELQVKTLFQRPGAIAGEIRAVQTIGDTLGGGDLTDEEREALPEWMRGGINTVLSREGSHVSVLSTIGSPIEQPFQQLQPNQLLASVSPLLRVGPELMMNYSMFHGKSISEVTNAAAFKSAPDTIKDFIGYTEVTGVSKDGEPYTYYTSLRPKRMHLLLNLPPTSRIISEIKGLQKPGVDTHIKAWDFLVGFNPYDMDLESEALKRENELKDELINVLDKGKAEIYTFDRTVIPDEMKGQ